MNEYIKLEGEKFLKEYKLIEEKIKEFDRIAIFRHIKPDFDALGTQFGLKTYIEENYPNKIVKVFGDNHVTFSGAGLIYPNVDKESDTWFDEDFLAIIVDVGDKKRIADPRFEKASFKIKLDHHPETDNIFDISVVDTSLAAASELVINMLLHFENNKISKEAAYYFYTAIVGDSGRYLFGSTTTHTFQVASILLETGLDIVSIYEKMYEKDIKDLEFTKYVLNNYKISEAGTAYYVLTQKDLDDLNLASEQGKEHVNIFSSIKGINIWCSITEDITEPCFRISLRSRYYNVNEVAMMFKGGGHNQASGAQIKDLSELDAFIKACDDKIKEGIKK